MTQSSPSTTYLYTHRWIMVAERSDDLSVITRTPSDIVKLVQAHSGSAFMRKELLTCWAK